MYDFLLPHEKEAIQAHEAKLKRQGIIADSPKFKYEQRVTHQEIGWFKEDELSTKDGLI